MLRVPVHAIEPGMILARPIPLPQNPYRYLLQRDREIPMDLVPRLRQFGITEVWIRHRQLEFLDDLLDEGIGDLQREVYHRVRESFQAIIRNSSAELDVVGFEQSISHLFGFLKGNSKSSFLLEKLDAFDNYLVSHSTNVCYLAMLLGMKLERYLIQQRRFKPAHEAKSLHLLGLGCLLHDIGKMRVPRQILDKPDRLTSAEMAEMQRHTTLGYEMVRRVIPASAAQIVLNHHQRWDGSGYPGRIDPRTEEELAPLIGRQIPIFSRIAVVADVYDAATSKRCYSKPKLPVQVLCEMRTRCQGFFDPVVESAFYRVVPPFPIGQRVRLSNGVEAAVIDFNLDFPARPKVQCLSTPRGEVFQYPCREEIDLSLLPELEIAWVDGQDVRPYTACQQSLETVSVLA